MHGGRGFGFGVEPQRQVLESDPDKKSCSLNPETATCKISKHGGRYLCLYFLAYLLD